MSNKKSIIKKVKKPVPVHDDDRLKRQQEMEIQKQQLEHQKRIAEEEYKRQLEEKKQELMEDYKLKLFKLNRNLIIQIEKEKLLQQKISEMQSDIDYYKDQLQQLGIAYKDDEDESN
jgi:hypothetical protein